MAFKLSWYIENRVALLHITGEYTVEDIEASATQLVDGYVEPGTAPVHVVVDNREMIGFPSSVGAIRKAIQPLITNPKIGWLIMIGEQNKAVKFLTSMTAHMLGMQSRAVTNEDELVSLLKRVDPALEMPQENV